MAKEQPGDEARSQYLDLCRDLENSSAAMRNHGMKPGNAWLAKAELAKIVQLTGELELILEDIKKADQSA